MMIREHTPGPWEVKDSYYIICSSTGVVIASTTSGNTGANGRLMAAAPDLLAAAKGAIYNLRVGDRVRADDLLNAIEKATGQEYED